MKLKHLWGIRHVRWAWAYWTWVLPEDTEGPDEFLTPNPLDALDDIWAGRD